MVQRRDNKEDEKSILRPAARLGMDSALGSKGRQEGGYVRGDAKGKDEQVAYHNTARKVAGMQQRGVAPAEEHGTDVEIAEAECRGGSGTRRAPLEVPVEQVTDGKGQIDKG